MADLSDEPPLPDGGGSAKRVAPAHLPCCVRPVLQLLLYDVLREGDDFVVTLRKGGMATLFVVAQIIFLVLAVGFDADRLSRTGQTVYFICGLQTALGWIVAYFVARWAPSTDTGTICTVGMLNNAAAVFLGSFGSTGANMQAVFIVQLIAVALMKLPGRYAWIAGLAVPYGVVSYHQAARSLTAFDHPTLYLDGADADVSISGRMATYVAAYLYACCIVLVFYAMHREYDAKLRASKASATLAAAVARRLARYDTDAAAAFLRHASAVPDDDETAREPSEENAGDVGQSDGTHPSLRSLQFADAQLIAALETIVANLDAYRPHLPNWMVDAAARSSSGALSPDANVVDDAADDTCSNASAASIRSSTAGGGGNARGARRRSSVLGAAGAGLRRRGSIRDGASGDVRKPAAAVVASDTIRTLQIVRARLGFQITPTGPTGDGTNAALSAVATAFVDGVHAAAQQTKAAVHSFIGDMIEVSWNAAARVPAGKFCAARFLVRVYKAVALLSAGVGAARQVNVEVGGGAIACRAKIQMAGGGQHQALLLSISDRSEEALRLLAVNGQRYGAMLVDEAIATDAAGVLSFPVATMPIAQSSSLRLPAPVDAADDGFSRSESLSNIATEGSSKLAPVHMLLHEVSSGDASHADWLYTTLQSRAGKSVFAAGSSSTASDSVHNHPSAVAVVEPREPVHLAVGRAFERAVKDRQPDGALRILDELSGADLGCFPLVARLKSVVAAAARESASQQPPRTAAGSLTAIPDGTPVDERLRLRP